jgi:hypothetical protein
MITTDDLILEYVYLLKTKIKHLMNPYVLNCPDCAYHGLNSEELLDKLIHLRNNGYIFFSISNDVIKENFSDNSELSKIPFVDSWSVGLTEKGGIRWESLFNPIWGKYTDFVSESLTNDLYRITLQTGTKENMEYILQKYGNSITSISEVIELNPWYPVYWKSVDKGFVVTFHVSENVMDNWELAREIYETNWRIKAW